MATTNKSNDVLSLLPVPLTVCAVIIGATLAIFYGWAAFALFAGFMPFPLILLWSGRDVPSPQERIAGVDAVRARVSQRAHRTGIEPVLVAHAHAHAR